MRSLISILIILLLCIAPISAEKNKGLFSGDILQADLDAFTANTSDTPSFTNDGTPEEENLQDIAEWVNIGKTQLKIGNWAAAEEAFSKVTQLDPKNNDGWEGYLLAIRGEGDFDKLLTAAEDAAEKDPGFVSIWKYKGIALSGLDRPEEALAAFDKALEVDPAYYQAWYYKGIAYNSLKRYDEAIRAYDQVLSVNPGYAKAWNNKGAALNYLGRYDEAIVAFEKAIEIDPGYETASKNKDAATEEKRKMSLDSVDLIDDSEVIIPSSGSNEMITAVITMAPTMVPTQVVTPAAVTPVVLTTPLITAQPTFTPVPTPIETQIPMAVESSATKAGSNMFRGNPARTGEYPGPAPLKGELKWRILLGEYENAGITSTPAIDNGIIYVGTSDMHHIGKSEDYVYAINAESGDIKWKFKIGARVNSPAVVDGIVYVTTGTVTGYIYAIDSRNGKLIWKSKEMGNRVEGSSNIVDGILYNFGHDGYIYALDAKTGKERWKFDTGDGFGYSRSSPAVVDGVLYIGIEDDYIYALDTKTGKVKWKYFTDSAVYMTPAIVDEVLYVGDQKGYFYAIDTVGGELIWKDKDGDRINSPAVVYGGIVYVITFHGEHSGDEWLLALDSKSGEIIWKKEFKGWYTSDPIIVDGIIYLGYNTGLFALDPKTGEEITRYGQDFESCIFSNLAAADGALYLIENTYTNGDFIWAVE